MEQNPSLGLGKEGLDTIQPTETEEGLAYDSPTGVIEGIRAAVATRGSTGTRTDTERMSFDQHQDDWEKDAG